MGKQRYKMHIAYDGKPFCGWQVQPNATSVQSVLQKALKTICQKEVWVTGSGRTDAGVHALGQVAHFDLEEERDPLRLLWALNGLLPEEVRVTHLEPTQPTFHARYGSIGKEYHYHICLRDVQLPFTRRQELHLRYQVDLPLLKAAAQRFVGTHDFTSFANQPREGAVAKNPVRTIYRLDVIETEQGVRLEFEGNGFLYKMVRTITGTLIEVARGKRPLDSLDALFAARDRRLAGWLAPAHGLCLLRVDYPSGL